MKPDWDRLMKHFEGSADILVADVDCTADGKSKCQEFKVRSFPTILYGAPGSTLQKYSGPRGFDELKKFAENLAGGAAGAASAEDDTDFDPDLPDDFVPGTAHRRRVQPAGPVTTTTTTTTQCHLQRLELCSEQFRQTVADYRGYSLAQIDGLIKAKESRKAKMEAEGKQFYEDNALRLLQEVRDEKEKENLEKGEL
mmetsp:Transcript_111497/g.299239  ORF Transcript_111497/g.299239 Transcript_111497/m.299239 type:complete len:197 (+) Transcript_111497:240-830(+)